MTALLLADLLGGVIVSVQLAAVGRAARRLSRLAPTLGSPVPASAALAAEPRLGR
jgi:hypothetical protein